MRQQAIEWNGYELRSYNGVPNHGSISQSNQLQLLHAYAACVSYVDTQIGRLLDQLANSPQAANTIVILISDHGWHLGEHSAWGKMTNFEIATRVPMIITGPAIKPARSATIAELVDVYPTLCELTGTPLPKHLEGESLVQTIRNPANVSPDSVAISQYSRFRNRYMGTALRTRRYRFVRWVDTNSGDVVHRELYDHHSDPHETNNLAELPRYADRIRELSVTLLKAEIR